MEQYRYDFWKFNSETKSWVYIQNNIYFVASLHTDQHSFNC